MKHLKPFNEAAKVESHNPVGSLEGYYYKMTFLGDRLAGDDIDHDSFINVKKTIDISQQTLNKVKSLGFKVVNLVEFQRLNFTTNIEHNKFIVDIRAFEDEWYFVKIIERTDPDYWKSISYYYECDQLTGLSKLLQDYFNIKNSINESINEGPYYTTINMEKYENLIDNSIEIEDKYFNILKKFEGGKNKLQVHKFHLINTPNASIIITNRKSLF